jgi:hypothetical protein
MEGKKQVQKHARNMTIMEKTRTACREHEKVWAKLKTPSKHERHRNHERLAGVNISGLIR